ncbi:MAG: Lrp/AsnC ligand binding domain-containing protein [Actinomycetota bacterium]
MTVGKYDGLHAFVFMHRVPPGKTIRNVIRDVRRDRDLYDPDRGPVMFAAECQGDFIAFLHLVVEEGDVKGLEDLRAGSLWDHGVRSEVAIEHTVFGAPAQPMGPKRGSPRACGLQKVYVEPNERAREVLDRMVDVPGFQGASTVSGSFDILLEVGAEDVDSLLEASPVDALHGIPGVERSEAAIAIIAPDEEAG